MSEWRTTDRANAPGVNTSAGAALQCPPDAWRRSRAPARALFSPRTVIPPQRCRCYRPRPAAVFSSASARVAHPCYGPKNSRQNQLAQQLRHSALRPPIARSVSCHSSARICEICGYRRCRFSASPRPVSPLLSFQVWSPIAYYRVGRSSLRPGRRCDGNDAKNLCRSTGGPRSTRQALRQSPRTARAEPATGRCQPAARGSAGAPGDARTQPIPCSERPGRNPTVW